MDRNGLRNNCDREIRRKLTKGGGKLYYFSGKLIEKEISAVKLIRIFRSNYADWVKRIHHYATQIRLLISAVFLATARLSITYFA
jgi:hypothetical protein